LSLTLLVGVLFQQQLAADGHAGDHEAEHRVGPAAADPLVEPANQAKRQQGKTHGEHGAHQGRDPQRRLLVGVQVVAVDLQFLPAARELVDPLFDLDSLAEQRDLRAGLLDRLAEIGHLPRAADLVVLLDRRIEGPLGFVSFLAGLVELFVLFADELRRAAEDADRFARQLVQRRTARGFDSR
jgi:hypothetical protein